MQYKSRIWLDTNLSSFTIHWGNQYICVIKGHIIYYLDSNLWMCLGPQIEQFVDLKGYWEWTFWIKSKKIWTTIYHLDKKFVRVLFGKCPGPSWSKDPRPLSCYFKGTGLSSPQLNGLFTKASSAQSKNPTIRTY